MISHFLLGMMFFCYCLAIYPIYCEYNKNTSISHYLCKKEVCDKVMMAMLGMSFFTILYEISRGKKCIYSLIFTTILVFSIISLIIFPVDIEKTKHYIFAFLIFFSIISYMFCYFDIPYSKYFVFLQVLLAIYIIFSLWKDKDIFYTEVLFLLCFFLFYMYLHFHYCFM